ncbi:hypothetical protein I4U23_022801, partial [Adineta vaga]
CNKSFASLYLDRTDVCDGYVDCLNNQIDEEYCWRLKINECNENEYRCDNGQCISKEFNGDQSYTFDCLDRSDPFSYRDYLYFSTTTIEPSIHEGDIQCLRSSSHSTIQFTSSCFDERKKLLEKIIFLETLSLMSDDYWSIFRCSFDIFPNSYLLCGDIYVDDSSLQIINETCPDLIIYVTMIDFVIDFLRIKPY